MVGKTQGAYAATYAYRFGDKLKAVTSSFPGETASVGYNYDGLGRRRLEQRDNTTATWFRWSGSEECGEYAGTVGSWTIGALQTGYVPGLATVAGSNPITAEWRYHLTDHLGSVRQLTGQTKAALARYDYAPYGELLRSAGLPLTVGYTGHLWDSAIGQYYAPFRYYNPQTARWNMRDPLGFVDGPNVYAYVAGNPVNYVDPYGLNWASAGKCFFKGVLVGAAVTAAVGIVSVGAVAAGVPVAAVTLALGVGALVGAGITGGAIGLDVMNRNWDGLAYTGGSLLGGVGMGRIMAVPVRDGIKPGGGPFRWWDWNLRYDPKLGSIRDWLGTGPTPASAMGSTAAIGAGGVTPPTRHKGGC